MDGRLRRWSVEAACMHADDDDDHDHDDDDDGPAL
jgi:hypothetical protein